jgi:hypothetical protein
VEIKVDPQRLTEAMENRLAAHAPGGAGQNKEAGKG